MKINATKKWMTLSAGSAVLLAITLNAATSNVIGVGTMTHSDLFGGPATVIMRTLTFEPEEVLGWHAHPGIGAYTIVTQGTLVVEDGCGGEQTYAAGDAFLEPANRVHRGKNLTTDKIVTAQTFIVPAGSAFSVSTSHLCGAPLAVDECRNAGWMNFNHPRTFKSQGDCEQYVITGK
jgi:quercetin dioxygenase-like cupin family protein